MLLDNVKIDFQFTGWCVEKDRPARFGPLSRAFIRRAEGFDKTLSSIAQRAYADGENRALFFLDYYQPKYQRVLDQGLGEVEKKGFTINDGHKDTFVGLSRNGENWLYLVRGREYMCREGHVIAGAVSSSLPTHDSWYSCGPKLEEVLKFEKDQGAILIPSHPLSQFGLGVKAILKMIREPSGTNLGLQEEILRENARYFDAIEAYSLSMDPQQTGRVENLAEELDIPVVSNTDGDLTSCFVAHNTFDFIDFSNPDNLRKSIREGLINRRYSQFRDSFHKSTLDKIKHILINVAQNRKYF